MKYTYELFEGGYYILIEDVRSIAQGGKYGNFFPYRVDNEDGTINIEESAKAHVNALIDGEKAQQEEMLKPTQLDTIESYVAYISMMLEGE